MKKISRNYRKKGVKALFGQKKSQNPSKTDNYTRKTKKINNICLKKEKTCCRMTIKYNIRPCSTVIKKNFRCSTKRECKKNRYDVYISNGYLSNKDVEKRKVRQMANIGAAAKYFIQLYFQTTLPYQCSRMKIEKLLSIVNYVSLKSGKPLFNQIMRVNQCGTGFPEISWLIREDIKDGQNDDSGIKISPDMIDKTRGYPEIYHYDTIFNDDERKLFNEVFCTFGAYSAKYLGIAINEFVDKISVTNNDSERPIIDYDKAMVFFENDDCLTEFPDNKIILFIKNYK